MNKLKKITSLLFCLSSFTWAESDWPSNDPGHLEGIYYSYSLERDSFYVSFDIAGNPDFDYELYTSKNVLHAEFNNCGLPPLLTLPEEIPYIKHLAVREFSDFENQKVTKFKFHFFNSPEYSYRKEGSMLTVALKVPILPDSIDNSHLLSGIVEPCSLLSIKKRASGDKLSIILNFNKLPDNRVSYISKSPTGYVLDFYNTTKKVKETIHTSIKPLKKIKTSYYETDTDSYFDKKTEMTKVFLHTETVVPIKQEVEGNKIILTMEFDGWNLSARNFYGPSGLKSVSNVLTIATLAYTLGWLLMDP